MALLRTWCLGLPSSYFIRKIDVKVHQLSDLAVATLLERKAFLALAGLK